MIRLVVRPQAIKDVRQIARTIAAANTSAAVRFIDAVAQTYAFLATQPFIGNTRQSKSRRLAGLRSCGVIGFRHYLVFFVPSDSLVDIIRVLHGARDTDQIMGPVA